MNPEEHRMNQMNQMNLFEGLWHEKIFFHVFGCLLAVFCFIEVHRSGVEAVFGSFCSIFFILLVTTMNQMYIDEPLSIFKRFFAFGKFTDEPLEKCQVHRGSFGSLRKRVSMDKKVLTVFLALLSWMLAGCGVPGAVQAAGVIGTAGPTATRTLSPTPTVGWQATAVAAQATADEARRVNAQATAAHEAFELEKIRVTEGAEIREHEKFAGTATAASTAVPLTATARVQGLTATAEYMALEAGQLTATHEAPTQVVAMARADLEREWGWVNYAAMGCLAFFLFGLGVFALGRSRGGGEPMVTHQQTVEAEAMDVDEGGAAVAHPNQVEVEMKKNHGGGFFEKTRYFVPCTAEQLSELARRMVIDNETLGVNNWEGDGSTLTRKVIYALRNWFQMNGMAVSAAAGRVKLNEKGMAFLREWLDMGALPHSFVFRPDGDLPLNMSHESGAHVPAHGGGA